MKQAEQSSPCILLIDEVEKLFHTHGDDSGVTSRLLGSILWWLQEHESKVFTIMTTNKESAIPPELYRQGRIDQEVNFGKLSGGVSKTFADTYCTELCLSLGIPYLDHDTPFSGSAAYTHAEVVGLVNKAIQDKYLQLEKSSG